MNALNLDIDTYTIFDLTQLFSLNSTYTKSEVNAGKDKLLHQLKDMQGISNDKKLNIHMFIDNASTRLIHDITENKSTALTWEKKENIMIPTGDDHYVIEDINRVAGKKSSMTEGRIGGTNNQPPGWLNPINIKTTLTGMNIDSRFRKDYANTSSSDFSFELPEIQRKVTNMRIASVDIPMSYYAVSRERGDATFIITYVEPSNSTLNEHPCFRGNSVNVNYLIDTSDPSRPVVFSSDIIDSSSVFTFGWLFVLPDGNYEMSWQNSSRAADITDAMNNALRIAMPGILMNETGKFLLYGINDDTSTGTTEYGIYPELDLSYSVDQPSGQSIFSIPIIETVNSLFYDVGFIIHFNTNPGGSLMLGTKNNLNQNGSSTLKKNIQLNLGWQLGYRQEEYTSTTTCISESVCLVVGPRCMFISIDDGEQGSGKNLIVAYSESTMQESVITRINLTKTMDTTRVYKSASDVGLNTQLNRAREYFGPVTISKLKFKLLDEYGRVISLNYMDWSVALVFEKLYD